MPGVTAGNRRLRVFRSRDDTHVHPGKEERDVENRSRKQFGPFVFDEGERILWRDDVHDGAVGDTASIINRVKT